MANDSSEFAEFILPERRRRYRELLATERGRQRVAAALPHFRHFDPRCIVALDPAHDDAASVERLLRARGATDTCHMISESRELDRQTLPLDVALRRIIGWEEGTVVICRPGLAFYEGEDGRFILQRG